MALLYICERIDRWCSMPGISSLGSSCSDNLCRLTLLSWNTEQRLRMCTDTLTDPLNVPCVASFNAVRGEETGAGARGGRGGWPGGQAFPRARA